MAQNQTTVQMLQDLIGHAIAGMEKAASIRSEYNEKQAEIEAMIPQVVNALVDNHHISPSKVMKTSQLLRHPFTALHMLQKVASNTDANHKSALGTVYKSASHKSSESGVDPLEAVYFN